MCSTPINVPAAINGTAAIERSPRLRMIGFVTVDDVTSSRIVGVRVAATRPEKPVADREPEALEHLLLEADRRERHEVRPRRFDDEHGGSVCTQHVPKLLEERADEVLRRPSVQVDRRDGGQTALELAARRRVGHDRQASPERARRSHASTTRARALAFDGRRGAFVVPRIRIGGGQASSMRRCVRAQ